MHILLLRTQKCAIVKKPVGLCLMHHFQDLLHRENLFPLKSMNMSWSL